MSTHRASEIVARAEELYHDLSFASAGAWKRAAPGRRVVGYLPVFAPIEIVTAADMLPLGICGGGDMIEIIRGDAYFQSYICHLPRSVVELAVSGRLDCCDAFLFPSTCDVIRNLSGIFQLQFPERLVKYVDVPQDFDAARGGRWWRHELGSIREALERLGGRKVTDEALWAAIAKHDEQRRLVRALRDLRSEEPWRVPTSELYLVQRAGLVLPVDAHVAMLRDYLAACAATERPRRDNIRVVVAGAFCEQPPLELLTTLERAGAWVVDDDLLLGPRFLTGDVVGAGGASGDPLDALVEAYLDKRTRCAFVHVGEEEKGAHLVEVVRRRRAEGVVFASPSFCDPALLDRPMLAAALDRAGISHTSFKYAENTGQFQGIREQVGTFADSLKLWGAA